MKRKLGLYLDSARLEALAFTLNLPLSTIAERGVELMVRGLRADQRRAFEACLSARMAASKGGA
jgi:hypothetical protein